MALRTRQDWVALADRMLEALLPYTSASHAQIVLPGPEGGYGRDVDGLEGFARSFLIAGFRAAGEGADPTGVLGRYGEGLLAGTDPRHPERWPRLDEKPQAKVEAAMTAYVLELTRPLLWDRLATAEQGRVIDYLSPAVGDDTYPQINWVWFRLMVQTFLRSVGGPFSLDEMRSDLDAHDGFRTADGWVADGAQRAYDHYTGWILTLFPILWARMAGAADLASERCERDRRTLDRYLTDAVRLVGADGSPLLQGRSLTYRFAAAAPFWGGVLAEVPSTPAGLLRDTAAAVVSHFVDRHAPDERGLLTLGWHHEWPAIAQAYSGPSSPYWAALGFLGLVLPASHPVWGEPESVRPVNAADQIFTVAGPGWVVTSSHTDGVVRVINHGTDHALEHAVTGDSPLYARFGYSTATAPVMDAGAWDSPADNAVALVDAAGNRSHRSGMRLLDLGVAGDVAYAVSVADAHWVSPDEAQQDHGYGITGTLRPAGSVTTLSLARGCWELRATKVVDAPDATALRLSGWPVTEMSLLGSALVPLNTEAVMSTEARQDASPLGRTVTYPYALVQPVPHGWVTTLVSLGADDSPAADAAITDAGAHITVAVTWPDGARTITDLLADRTTAAPTQP